MSDIRKFWYVNDLYDIVQVTGYSVQSYEGAWWVPSYGRTMWEGTSLFDTEQEAILAASQKINQEVRRLEIANARLARRQEILMTSPARPSQPVES